MEGKILDTNSERAQILNITLCSVVLGGETSPTFFDPLYDSFENCLGELKGFLVYIPLFLSIHFLFLFKFCQERSGIINRYSICGNSKCHSEREGLKRL